MGKPAMVPSKSTVLSDSSGECTPLTAWFSPASLLPSAAAPSADQPLHVGDPASAYLADIAAAGPLSCAGYSRRGSTHRVNQDMFLLQPELGLFALADGISGLPHGEVAARLAVSSACSYLQTQLAALPALADLPRAQIQRLLADAVAFADFSVRDAAEERRLPMGCTLDLALVHGDSAFLAHVGDARIYRHHAGRLTLLTRDHTMASELADAIGPEGQAAMALGLTHVLCNAIGCHEQPLPALGIVELGPGDRLLLCTDGVHGELALPKMQDLLNAPASMAAWALIRQVGRQRGGDDATAVVIARRGG